MTNHNTTPLGADFQAYASRLDTKRRQDEAPILDALFREATGFEPHLWSGGLIGYGLYDYTYASGRSGTWLATGFAPRKAKISIHILPGYADHSTYLDKLGKHSKGRSCLYVNKLADIDLDVLRSLIRAGLEDLARHWPVRAA